MQDYIKSINREVATEDEIIHITSTGAHTRLSRLASVVNIGRVTFCSYGLRGKIVKWYSSDKIKIRMEDGTEKLLRSNKFFAGQFLPDKMHRSTYGEYHGYKITGIAFKLNNKEDVYYYCNKLGTNVQEIKRLRDIYIVESFDDNN